jgi:hypothetical protein
MNYRPMRKNVANLVALFGSLSCDLRAPALLLV